MQNYELRIHGSRLNVELPDDWKVNYLPIHNAPALSDDQLLEAFARPIGTPPIREIAKGKRSAVILVEDLTRPCPAHLLMPIIIEQLREGGIKDDGISVVMSIGTHRPLSACEFRQKLGDWVVDNFPVTNAFAYATFNQTCVGTTSEGIEVRIWKEVAEADMRISVGALLPHPMAGFTGGGKLILPGVAAIESIATMHKFYVGRQGPAGNVDNNPLRQCMEEAARMARLDVIVESVVNADQEIVGLFVGDLVAAHREGAKLVRELYTVDAPNPVDIVIASGYPKDREVVQANAAVEAGMAGATARVGGTVLLVASGDDGIGFHGLREYVRPSRRKMRQREGVNMMICSPHAPAPEIMSWVNEDTRMYRDLSQAVADLVAMYQSPTVNIIPQGPFALLDDR